MHQDLKGLNVSGADHASNHGVATLASVVEALEESHLQGAREAVRAPVTTVRDAFGDPTPSAY